MMLLERYLNVHRALKEQRAWYQANPTVCALQALMLTLGNAENLVDEVPSATQKLMDSANWFSTFRGMMGETLAAMALVRGMDPALLPPRTEQIRARFKEVHVPRMGWWPLVGAAFLAFEEDEVVDRALPRMEGILERWRADHPWLTGADDVLAAAAHAIGDHSPEEVARQVEDRYQALLGAGASANNSLQRAAQFGALQPSTPANELAGRYGVIALRLSERGWRVAIQRPDVTCLLALIDAEHSEIVDDVVSTLSRVSKELSWVTKPLVFAMGAGLVVGEHTDKLDDALQGHILLQVIAVIQTQIAIAVMTSTA